jgi:hypothetical protein
VAKENSGNQPARRRTIPLWGELYAWWPQAVRARLADLKIDQKFLSTWIEADPTAVNKCITRKVPVYELLLDISDALDIPYPVVLPESFDEALRVARERRLARRDAQVAQIKAGVTDRRESGQIRAISLADVSEWKARQNEAPEYREKSPRVPRPSR